MSESYVSQEFKFTNIVLPKDSTGQVEVFAGSSKEGNRDGTPQESEFNGPNSIAIDHKSKTCFITDGRNHRIRTIKY